MLPTAVCDAPAEPPDSPGGPNVSERAQCTGPTAEQTPLESTASKRETMAGSNPHFSQRYEEMEPPIRRTAGSGQKHWCLMEQNSCGCIPRTHDLTTFPAPE
ncbi:unnamed protein product [Dibothriocephalus latus]|uniref:Uncharacterized protein n=1 Tax=Dibothriocephalus latus TaxID=60516 RepID=A0A3P7REV2_DIBLA|nr:unnamed protein product [Dibothriocephalus latus]